MQLSKELQYGKAGEHSRRDTATKVLQVATEPRTGRHSEKPTVFYERIMELWDGPYVELFARRTYWSWDCWGNEAPDESA